MEAKLPGQGITVAVVEDEPLCCWTCCGWASSNTLL
jgi:hypothetical protein